MTCLLIGHLRWERVEWGAGELLFGLPVQHSGQGRSQPHPVSGALFREAVDPLVKTGKWRFLGPPRTALGVFWPPCLEL